MSTTLYHTTTTARANSIMAEGFCDNATINKRLTATYHYDPGVWFGNVPALDDELFDGVGLFGFDAERQVFISVNVDLPHLDVIEGNQDRTWPGTQYWAKADVWNQFPRVLLSLDDVVKLRVRNMSRSQMKAIKEYCDRD